MLLFVALTPLHDLNPWWVLGLSVFKQCTEVQLSNSVYKIFKMRLQNQCNLHTCASQCHVVSAVGIVSELIELVFNLGTCFIAYQLMTSGATFSSVKFVYFGMTLFATLCCACLGISISCNAKSFYHPTSKSNLTLIPNLNQEEVVNVTTGLLSSSSSSLSSSSLSSSTVLPALLHIQDDTNTNSTVDAAAVVCCCCCLSTSSICRRLKGVLCVPVALGSIVVMCALYASQEVLYNVESLHIPGANVLNTTATTNNFCAGYLTNTVYQDVWENVFYLLGTLFYILVLKQTSPLIFFRWVLPIGMIFLVVISGTYFYV